MSSAFSNFYAAEKDRLFAYLLRRTGDYALAADIMQESFARYFERYASREHTAALLFTISRTVLTDFYRHRKNEVAYDDELDQRQTAGSVEKTLQIKEEHQQLLASLQRLSSEERELLALVSGGGLSYREIAVVLDISEANVKVKVHRARCVLKKILAEADHGQ